MIADWTPSLRTLDPTITIGNAVARDAILGRRRTEVSDDQRYLLADWNARRPLRRDVPAVRPVRLPVL